MKKQKSKQDVILDYQNRAFSIKEQKAALLLRNGAFQADLQKVRIHFSFKNRADKIMEASYRKKTSEITPLELNLPTRDYSAGTQWFIEKWEIDKYWDGRTETLHENIKAGALLYSREVDDPQWNIFDVAFFRGIPKQFECYLRALPLSKPALFIRVDPWTTKEQIIKLCRFLPRKKAQLFGFTAESKRYFARDLCWYDLEKTCRLTPPRIAQLWSKKRRDEFTALLKRTKDWKAAREENRPLTADAYIEYSLSQTIHAAIARLRKGIDYLTR